MGNLFEIIKAADVVNATKDAYKYESFGYDEWYKCAVFLFEEGLCPEQVEYILRSKHMRWSEDYAFPDESDSECFISYYHANINNVKTEL